MAKKSVVINPPAALDWREGDLVLPFDQYLKMSFFAKLKSKPSVDKFPGTIVVRRFRKGEVIVRQGEAGWTAFSILTTEDALDMCRIEKDQLNDDARRGEIEQEIARRPKGPTDPAKAVQDVRKKHPKEIKALEELKQTRDGTKPEDPKPAVAMVHLVTARPTAPRPASLLDRLLGRKVPAAPPRPWGRPAPRPGSTSAP